MTTSADPIARSTALAWLLPLALLAQGAPVAPPPLPSHLALSPCSLPGVPLRSECGSFEVAENRSASGGRRLRLNVVVLRARVEKPQPDPAFYLAGGPGVGATGEAAFVAATFAPILAGRDIVLVDLRGTGRSNPLDCALGIGLLPTPAAETVAACRERLAARADLRLYGTATAMDDLDDLRAALGASSIDLLAHSYGTLAAQVYLARHGEHVRAAVLESVLPPGPAPYFTDSRDAERALAAVLAACAAQPACHAAYPDPRGELTEVLRRVARQPQSVHVEAEGDKGGATVVLTRDLFAATLRARMYSARAAAHIPRALHRAFRGDYADMAHAAWTIGRGSPDGLSQGLFLAVSCSESLGLLTRRQVESQAPCSFLGPAPLLDRLAACNGWPRGGRLAEFAQPLSQVPTLLLSGAWDPVTPPQNAELVRRGLPHSLALTLPEAGHAFDDGCTASLAAAVFANHSVKDLATACIAGRPRVVFAMEP